MGRKEPRIYPGATLSVPSLTFCSAGPSLWSVLALPPPAPPPPAPVSFLSCFLPFTCFRPGAQPPAGSAGGRGWREAGWSSLPVPADRPDPLPPLAPRAVFEFMPYMGITLATIFTMLRLANEAKMRQAICSGTCLLGPADEGRGKQAGGGAQQGGVPSPASCGPWPALGGPRRLNRGRRFQGNTA